ncbi:hypothetical protein THAR02_00270 [Trichoderma harzianum]|uniref:Uncharacterized protein n=1 Tax=Trichoderma harzianum TaxID=5544 RepID=A0A0F9XSW4_TRIHA|nr:hypothetical protein THAR02_00270 [Trichoderma harzianum]
MHDTRYQRAKLCVLFARIVGVAAFGKGEPAIGAAGDPATLTASCTSVLIRGMGESSYNAAAAAVNAGIHSMPHPMADSDYTYTTNDYHGTENGRREKQANRSRSWTKLDEAYEKMNVLFLSGRYGGVPDPMPLTNPKRDAACRCVLSRCWLVASTGRQMNTPGLSIDSAYQYLGNANMRTITDGVFKGWPVNQELGCIGPFPDNVGKRDGWMEEEKHKRRRDHEDKFAK